MKKVIILLVLTLFIQVVKGQNPVPAFEFGYTLVTFNSSRTLAYVQKDRPSLEFINGIFLRYSKKRLGARFVVSYSDNSKNYNTKATPYDGSGVYAQNKDFRIGLGGQFSLLKNKDWLYSFMDFSYRNKFSTRRSYGGPGSNGKSSLSANGLDSFFGLGFKIKAFRSVYLSPELGYSYSRMMFNESAIPLDGGNSYKINYSIAYFYPAFKLHISVKI